MKLTIEIPDDQAELIQQFLQATDNDTGLNGPLAMPKLAAMLLEDVALVMRRPGSWEGANMLQVVSAHGYDW